MITHSTDFLSPGADIGSSPSLTTHRKSLVGLMADGFYMLLLIQRGQMPPERDKFWEAILKFLTDLERKATEEGISAQDIDAGKYAFCAAVDEVILSSPSGPVRDQWQLRPLQLFLYGDQLAGDRFFAHLEGLRGEGIKRLPSLEVFYLCLLMGFQGKFRIEGAEKLGYLTARLGDELIYLKGKRTSFAPHWAAPDRGSHPLRRYVPLWLPALVLGVIGLVSYSGLAIMTNTLFHVYIVLPVHPEGGGLDNPAIATQVHWTQQSIAFGTQSLLNGIRAYLKMKKLRDDCRLSLDECAAVLGRELSAIQQLVGQTKFNDIDKATDEQCFEYVTLLNLRNWANLYGNYVTEQIYVHSKMMIVDDRYALIGSANINDRSLLGTRDSELAVLIMDLDVERRDYLNNGNPLPTQTFARELRRGVWSKLFGLTSGVRPAEELRDAIETPGCPTTWRKIQQVAQRNTEHYEAVFKYIPKSSWMDPIKGGTKFPASIWPVINTDVRQQVEQSAAKSRNAKIDFAMIKKDLMPFEADFWKSPPYNTAQVKRLEDIRGFITTYPVHWTEGENNNMQYHMALMARHNQNTPLATPALPTDEITLAVHSAQNKDTHG